MEQAQYIKIIREDSYTTYYEFIWHDKDLTKEIELKSIILGDVTLLSMPADLPGYLPYADCTILNYGLLSSIDKFNRKEFYNLAIPILITPLGKTKERSTAYNMFGHTMKTYMKLSVTENTIPDSPERLVHTIVSLFRRHNNIQSGILKSIGMPEIQLNNCKILKHVQV